MADFSVIKNIFQHIPDHVPDEWFERIVDTPDLKIERIVSRGHASSPGFWYDQDKNEFVLLLKGRAGLAFEGERDLLVMRPGDYANIPAHVKHRVEWTDPEHDTVWLAVHY